VQPQETSPLAVSASTSGDVGCGQNSRPDTPAGQRAEPQRDEAFVSVGQAQLAALLQQLETNITASMVAVLDKNNRKTEKTLADLTAKVDRVSQLQVELKLQSKDGRWM